MSLAAVIILCVLHLAIQLCKWVLAYSGGPIWGSDQVSLFGGPQGVLGLDLYFSPGWGSFPPLLLLPPWLSLLRGILFILVQLKMVFSTLSKWNCVLSAVSLLVNSNNFYFIFSEQQQYLCINVVPCNFTELIYAVFGRGFRVFCGSCHVICK